MGKELRRYQNRTVTCGIGIISFGFWAMIRSTAAFMTADASYFADLIEKGITLTQIRIVGFIVLAFIYAAVLSLYGFVCLRAISIGKGKKPRVTYLAVVAGIFIWSVYDVISTGKTIVEKYRIVRDAANRTLANYDVSVATLLVNITFTLIVAELFVSAYKVSRLMKKNIEAGGTA